MKSLIVDDDRTSCVILYELLRRFGPSHMVANGQEAIATACRAFEEGTPYDLVCLDVMMPGIDGHEVLRNIRTAEREIRHPATTRTRVLMVTALSDQDTIMKAYLDLCDDYLVKPVDIESFYEAIHDLGLI